MPLRKLRRIIPDLMGGKGLSLTCSLNIYPNGTSVTDTPQTPYS
ncbi:hypothetical protein CWATWH0402_5737 [Crocosphaera watsonii WH 0402]|uniref:Uncharacterized protein n=2 Tax=Crocosphaera watsonii TaxID=263511 RepID=T2JZA6_CROWT|nr:hypothetical protein CWATWH0005_3459 [Crocosphaera watsonii WH 0005]CCQ70409.1 hypothetical protein CWATWH0402_5737 [Crocosphaera watsonii WH 0402]